MSDRSKVLDRVRKLLRLAESPNVHEAAVAAAQAQRLMMLHRIEAASIEVDASEDETIDEQEVEHRKSRSTWRWDLLWAICRPNRCRPWMRSKNGRYVYTVFGTRSDADTVLYLYRLIERAIEQEVKARRGTKDLYGRSECHAFRQGAVVRVRARLQEANEDAAREATARSNGDTVGRALARLDQAGHAVETAMRGQGLGYGTPTRRRLGDIGAFVEGRKWGDTIGLGRHRGAVVAARRALKKG